ncbi:trypsin-like serine protease [Coccomyxa subellipsoidea C-169]|uniref:Trypsin-like serine protease n=1 Tax=Coccomyxa subellipsoidea (strain C-169) TaxID=574566 RepID=I0Z492_COCSC|nr:trypsin-like serine protease [Coccomyxa subellipsoidea C-169]EIE25461.1 trypsin-like serine protease [Coccomyxa subellipsoidea C-169]|eukprot:XP_005650005.1 trypsin-like serine protease [Coccomyxa subellipsoidea C-169]
MRFSLCQNPLLHFVLRAASGNVSVNPRFAGRRSGIRLIGRDQSYFMDEDMEASDQVEHLDATVLKRKRLEETDVGTNAKPASKATGKPVLNTRALRSVLKVFVVQAVPNYAQPWQMRPQRSSSGSAFVTDVQKRTIMTNAHVIMNATTVHVRRPGNPKKWRARILCEGIICDLALLTVDEPDFWSEDLMSLQFVSVPELQDSILVAGYPLGGDSLSITKGIVSRVVMTRYAHASNKLLGIQIDAAINPGNSGGPAFSDLQEGKVAGVAFSKLSQADNVGYIIPWKIVAHFLREYEDHGVFRGCCSVPPNGSGSLVFKIDPMAPATSVLKENDVVLEIEGVLIADDGTVEFRNEERVEFSHIVRSKHIDDWLHLLVLREGKEMELKYQLNLRRPLVPVLAGVDCVPSYFIIGGLVFVPLSIPFLEHAYGGHAWRKLAPVQILALVAEYRERPDEQVVVLFQVLAAEINFGYKFQTVRCESLNGEEVRNLARLAELVDSCTDKYMKFGLEGGKLVILERVQAIADAPRILQQHAIPFDRSADLRELKERNNAAANSS